jgi:hypothetical protein
LTFSRLGSKLKGVFKGATMVEGRLMDDDSEDSDAGTVSGGTVEGEEGEKRKGLVIHQYTLFQW